MFVIRRVWVTKSREVRRGAALSDRRLVDRVLRAPHPRQGTADRV